MKQGRPKRADILLLGSVLLAGCLLGLVLLLTSRTGARVRVRVAGETVRTFSLSDDVEYEIHGVNGGTNRLVIRDGRAWIEEASCPDKLCVRMGRVHRNGQSVVCLPNQVVVEIVGGENESDSIDVVAG